MKPKQDPIAEAFFDRPIHLSSALHPGFVTCGIVATPDVKRTPKPREATCHACLQMMRPSGKVIR